MENTPAPAAPVAPAAAPVPRKIGPSGPVYERRVVAAARRIFMDPTGAMHERLVETIGRRRSIEADERYGTTGRRAFVAVQ